MQRHFMRFMQGKYEIQSAEKDEPYCDN